MGSNWKKDVSKAKEYVGSAKYGTTQYNRNAAIVLSQHAGGMKGATKSKLESLASSGDSQTRRIARNALNGKKYPV